MMKLARNRSIRRLAGSIILSMMILTACEKSWDEHYQSTEDYVDGNLWDYLSQKEEYSVFTGFLKKYGIDTLLQGNQQYTLFITKNEVLEAAMDSIEISDMIIYHLTTPNVFSTRNVTGAVKLQTYSGKFALVQEINNEYYFEDGKIIYSSPLFRNGRYYEVDRLPMALPNIREYLRDQLKVMFEYSESMIYDSLDRKLSKPIYFDDNGNTVYDSVFITVNPFEDRYFTISEESREIFATFILPSQVNYDSALLAMAENIGSPFAAAEDIPLEWQYSLLIPSLLENGVFQGLCTEEILSDPNLLNINGKFVNLDVSRINFNEPVHCSNGIIYLYNNYVVPDSLYLGEVRIEGESLVDSIGLGRYAWNELATVTGQLVEPVYSESSYASNGALVISGLGRSFNGTYTVEFAFHNIFPGRHRLEWRANYRPSGIYKIYVNDEEIGSFDTFNLRYTVISVTGELFRPGTAGFNRVDFYVDNLTEYGDARVRFEYSGPGLSTDNGFNIDYVSLIPAPL